MSLYKLSTLYLSLVKSAQETDTADTEELYRRFFDLSYANQSEANDEDPSISPPAFSGGDYSGSAYTEANRRDFRQLFSEGEDVWWEEEHYPFNAKDIVIYPRRIPENEMQEVLNVLSALEDYPIISEEAVSEVELEMFDDALQTWYAEDFKIAYRKFIEGEFDSDKLAEFLANQLRDQKDLKYYAESENDFMIRPRAEDLAERVWSENIYIPGFVPDTDDEEETEQAEEYINSIFMNNDLAMVLRDFLMERFGEGEISLTDGISLTWELPDRQLVLLPNGKAYQTTDMSDKQQEIPELKAIGLK